MTAMAPARRPRESDAWSLERKQRARERMRLELDLKLQPKQRVAEQLSGVADELLYGGAAGGGKTEWLVRHCIRQMAYHPGNRGVIFRRVFPSLDKTIIRRLKELLRERAVYNGGKHTFTFPNGSVLELASLQYADDVAAYQGTEYGVIAFEEVTEFLESQYDYFKSRLRAPTGGIRPHLIATTNPGGVGHLWVKRYWVRPRAGDFPADAAPTPFGVWRPTPTDTDPDPRTRCFVPALLRDNPLLVARDPGYEHRLHGIKNVGLRRALEQGDWDAIEAVEGALWQRSTLDASRVRELPLHLRQQVVVGVDPSGGAGEQGIVVVAKSTNGHGYVLADRTCRLDPLGWARRVVAAYHEFQADVIVVERNFGGDMVKQNIRAVDEQVPVEMVTASRGKQVRAQPVASLFGEGWLHLVGEHPELEDQLCTWFPESGTSPDRLDAMTWAFTRTHLPEKQPATVTTLKWR